MWVLGLARNAGLAAMLLQGWQASDLVLNWGSLESKPGSEVRQGIRQSRDSCLLALFLNAENQDQGQARKLPKAQNVRWHSLTDVCKCTPETLRVSSSLDVAPQLLLFLGSNPGFVESTFSLHPNKSYQIQLNIIVTYGVILGLFFLNADPYIYTSNILKQSL